MTQHVGEVTATTARVRRAPVNLSTVPYLPGLDGMRAIAVVAVMLYHASSEWLHGGYLGVEVFFVISGYLITLLLMAEREKTGRVDLVAFWGRRIRRLFPALYLTMFLVLTYTMIFKSSVLGKLRGDLLAGGLYGMNWYQIWVGQGYASSNDFVPLRHLWSLAVEEQFYIVWPIAMMLMLRRGGTRRLAMTARWLAIGALAVTVVVALLHHGGTIGTCAVTPDAYWTVDPPILGERCISKMEALYLSTITRSSGLLMGAAFAMVWRPRAIMRGPLRDRNGFLDLVALGGLVALAALFWFVGLQTNAPAANPWLFRGGLLLTAIATLGVIAAVTHPYTLSGRVLGSRPLLWVGTRSYGLYLFHWPIYQVIRGVAGRPLTIVEFLVAMLITVPITEASYRMLELPIRRREFGAWYASLRTRRNPRPRQLMAGTLVVSVVALAVGVIRVGVADLQLNEVEAGLAAAEADTISVDDLLGTGGESAAGPADTPATGTTTPPPATDPAASSTIATTTSTTTTTTTTLPPGQIDLLAIGDSVMKGAAGVLSERGYTVMAEESLQMIDMVPIMEQLAEADKFGNRIIIHLGTNGTFEASTLDALLEPLSGVPNVILINVFANRSWAASNNAILLARDKPDDNIRLMDWAALALKCPGDCFAGDGIHLSAAGRKYYADQIGEITGR